MPKPVDQVSVLVFEDEPLNQTLIMTMLGILGIHKVTICGHGRDVPALIKGQAVPDLVLLDLQLPGLSGYEIIGRLREQPDYQTVPIVAMTAQVMPDAVRQAESLGFTGFLGKPLNFDRFPGQITRLLAGESVWEPR